MHAIHFQVCTGRRGGVCYTTVCTTESFAGHSLEDILCYCITRFMETHTHTHTYTQLFYSSITKSFFCSLNDDNDSAESTIAMIIMRWLMFGRMQWCNDIKCANNTSSQGVINDEVYWCIPIPKDVMHTMSGVNNTSTWKYPSKFQQTEIMHSAVCLGSTHERRACWYRANYRYRWKFNWLISIFCITYNIMLCQNVRCRGNM